MSLHILFSCIRCLPICQSSKADVARLFSSRKFFSHGLNLSLHSLSSLNTLTSIWARSSKKDYFRNTLFKALLTLFFFSSIFLTSSISPRTTDKAFPNLVNGFHLVVLFFVDFTCLELFGDEDFKGAPGD